MAFRSVAIAGSNTGGDLTATPAGVAVNDYLGGMAVGDAFGTPPSGMTGWTERANFDQAAPDTQAGRYMDTIATGSDDFTWTFPVDQSQMVIAAWSGRNTSAPRTAVQTTINTASNTSPISASMTGVTAATGDDIAVFIEMDKLSADPWTFSAITDYTERVEDSSVNFITSGMQTRDNVSGGATGALATTITRTSGTANSGYAGVVVAIAQAPSTALSRQLLLGVGMLRGCLGAVGLYSLTQVVKNPAISRRTLLGGRWWGKLVAGGIVLVGLLSAASADAVDHYIRDGATGSSPCTDWNAANACDVLPASLVRGDTYYIADGSYPTRIFDDTNSGTTLITVKKATVADHGTATGWLDTYGDGQAEFADVVAFYTGYYRFDGNGTHTIPSNTATDYGFKISSTSTTNFAGQLQFGSGSTVSSNVTVRYTYVFNTMNGNDNSSTVSVRWHPSLTHDHTKLQMNYFHNSGKDGLQITRANDILIERNYIQKLGKLAAEVPDNHGQTVTLTVSNTNIVFRWNVWDANEGQALIGWGDVGLTYANLRFYGNVVQASETTPGFNSTGGIFGNPYGGTGNNIALYNNTFVNQVNGSVHFHVAGNVTLIGTYGYNNLFYGNTASGSFTGATAYSYNASGGGGTAGGTNEQTGLSSSIFTNYATRDYRLAAPPETGLNLAQQTWWNDDADAFFGQLDYVTDMYGVERGSDGSWDRGAFELISLPNPSPPPGGGSYPSSQRPASQARSAAGARTSR